MVKVPYVFPMGILLYAQLCTHPNIAFVVNALGSYLRYSNFDRWKAVKKVM